MARRAAVPTLLAAVVAVLAVVAWLRPEVEPPGSQPPTVAADPAPTSGPDGASTFPSPQAPAAMPALPVTSDPGEYATAVAAVVFGMDTRATGAAAYRELLVREADPGMSAAGLADLREMVDVRVPAGELWSRMRSNRQWSQFTVAEVWEPGSWEQVVTGGLAEPGWVMRNVTGHQTTHYVEAGEARAAARERTLTVGMRCPAPGAGVDRCRLVLVGTSVVP